MSLIFAFCFKITSLMHNYEIVCWTGVLLPSTPCPHNLILCCWCTVSLLSRRSYNSRATGRRWVCFAEGINAFKKVKAFYFLLLLLLHRHLAAQNVICDWRNTDFSLVSLKLPLPYCIKSCFFCFLRKMDLRDRALPSSCFGKNQINLSLSSHWCLRVLAY